MTENCANCRFSAPASMIRSTGERQSLVCRRFPPTVTIYPAKLIPNVRTEFDAVTIGQPEVRPDDWCGEWLTSQGRAS
jgi:hypothetical protein